MARIPIFYINLNVFFQIAENNQLYQLEFNAFFIYMVHFPKPFKASE